MKKSIFAGLIAASTLGGSLLTVSPAQAATTVDYQPTTIGLNGQLLSFPEHVVSPDPWSGQSTSWLPVWYIYHSLSSQQITATWDGVHSILNFTIPDSIGLDLSNPPTQSTPGKGEMLVEFNGKPVMICPKLVAPDPSSKQDTTYFPIYYAELMFKRMGIASQWMNGRNWIMTTEYGAPGMPPLPSGNQASSGSTGSTTTSSTGSSSGSN